MHAARVSSIVDHIALVVVVDAAVAAALLGATAAAS